MQIVGCVGAIFGSSKLTDKVANNTFKRKRVGCLGDVGCDDAKKLLRTDPPRWRFRLRILEVVCSGPTLLEPGAARSLAHAAMKVSGVV